jgi:hypothetical protein
MGFHDPIKELDEKSLVSEGTSFKEITEIVSKVTEEPAPMGWWILFGISATGTGILGATVAYLLWTGIGVWGNNSARRLGLGRSSTSCSGSASATPGR